MIINFLQKEVQHNQVNDRYNFSNPDSVAYTEVWLDGSNKKLQRTDRKF